ncbi:MAG TPA: UDP-N-acetylglucosamine--N-acetylmuramyl-(pentapeptide) pyrophosphoryl-undecaprenol N-acetylglucosamine transferase [Candidatus Saccharimonadales bacterium]|nr:UDP-N-acetylglucosamine--N-acetylmuramyl-(pentapeptide) pyrophosphoryl-undecaprenol N-acetylglucosamine transferase [Candidatus Saccharimonadales bacterium]
MKILVCGGGTGGHVTPILAVAHELKKLSPDAQIIYVGERNGKFGDLVAQDVAIDEVHTIFAGKLRRYHGESWFSRLLDVKTLLKNIRDGFLVLIGIIQSMWLLSKVKPDVIFLKGGFVVVPIGFAAALRKIPFVTHDSDAMPGLANRLVGRWARWHATGMPVEFYNYPKETTRYVGVLVSEAFKPVDDTLQREYRAKITIPAEAKMLLITGGSLGAQRLNEAVAKLVPQLLSKYSDLYIMHQVGKGNLGTYKQDIPRDRLKVFEFISDMYLYMGAADAVVTRAGANNLAELGMQGKACIVVPNPQLSGGHQLENAKYLLQHHAVLVVDETSINNSDNKLGEATELLLNNPEARTRLGTALAALSKPQAARELAQLILEAAKP